MELEVVELVFVELVGSELALSGALVSRRRRIACIMIFETSPPPLPPSTPPPTRFLPPSFFPFLPPSSPNFYLVQIPYRETRRVSKLSGVFSDSERAFSSVKWEVDAHARVRTCACARVRVHLCGTGMTQIRRLFLLGVPVLLHFAELLRYTH